MAVEMGMMFWGDGSQWKRLTLRQQRCRGKVFSEDSQTDLQFSEFKLNHILTRRKDEDGREEFCVWFHL